MRGRTPAAVLLTAIAIMGASCSSDKKLATSTAPTTAASSVAPTTGGSGTTAGSGTEPATTGAAGPSTTAGATVATPCPAASVVPEFKMGVQRPPQSLDPSFAASSGSEGGMEIASLFGALMKYNVDTGEVEPDLAQSLEPNADFTEWTLTLRDGVKFGSGAPLNTDAVKFSIDLHRKEGSTSLAHTEALNIVDMQILSPTKMVFKLKAPWPTFSLFLGPTVGIPVDPAVYQASGAQAFAADPDGGGAGPFKLDSWVRGEQLTVTAKDDYWGTQACIKKLQFTPIADARTMVDAFAKGEIDGMVVRGPEGGYYAKQQKLDANKKTQVVNGGLVLFINNGARGQTRIGSDIRVRRAISLAIDPKQITDRVYNGEGEPSKALISAKSALYSSGIKEAATDPEQAKKLVAEVKAEKGWDGKLYMPTSTAPASVDVSNIIKAQLDAVGFDIQVDASFDPSALSKHLVETADYDIETIALSMFDSNIYNNLAQRIDYGTPTGWTGFDSAANPQWDQALQAFRAATSVADRKAALVKLSEVWNDVVPAVVLDHHELTFYWSKKFDGLDFTKDGIALFGGVKAAS